MTVIQIILTVFAAFGFAAAAARYRRGGLTRVQLALWSVLWLAVAAVALRPETATMLARRLGVGRGADVVVYFALSAAFYLLFRLYARLEDHERQITTLARELALKNIDGAHER